MKLIKISDEHYIVIDDSEVQNEGVRCYSEYTKEIIFYKLPHTIQCKKITHSFGKYLEGVENRPLNKLEEVLFDYSVEEMAENKWNEITTNLKLDTLHKGMWRGGFQHGFNAHKELVKDKFIFSEDNLKTLLLKVYQNGQRSSEICEETSSKLLEQLIQSLQPTELEVEFVNGKLTLKQ